MRAAVVAAGAASVDPVSQEVASAIERISVRPLYQCAPSCSSPSVLLRALHVL